jgi:PAS domain S-box-containing protein
MGTDGNSVRLDSSKVDYERLSLALEGLHAGVWDWDLVNSEVYWSPRLFEQLGYLNEELVPDTSTLQEHAHPSDLELLTHSVRVHLNQREKCEFKCRFQNKEGRYCWFHVSGQAQWNEVGNPIRFVGILQDITGSKGEDQFKSLVATPLDWVWEMNLAGRHTYTNRRVEEILGYGVEEFYQLNVFELFHAKDRREVENRLPDLVTKKEGWSNWVLRILAKDGTYRYLESGAVPILDSNGEMIGYRGIDRDITQRRLEQRELNDRLHFEKLVSELSTSFLSVPSDQIEEELDRALVRLADFFDLDQCAVICYSPESSELVLSRLFERENLVKESLGVVPKRFPWTASVVNSGRVVRITSIEDLPPEAELEREYMQTAGLKAYMTIPMVLTGQVIGRLVVSDFKTARNWLASEIKRLRFVAELLAASIVRKQQESELEKTRSMLMASVESSPAGIVIADAPDGKIRIVNRAALISQEEAAETVTGIEMEEYTRRWRFLKSNGDVYATEEMPLSRAILQGETLQNVEVVIELPDGERRWILNNAAPVRDATGEIVAGVNVFTDITELKQTAADREKLILELEDKNAELERFTYTVSHDLKSPLITIKGFLGLLQEELQRGDLTKIESRIQKVFAASDQMSRLLGELLELSRIGRIENIREWVSVTEIAQQAADLNGSAIESKQVIVDIEPDMPAVLVDRNRVVEVFQNLIDNAVRFASQAAQPRVQVGRQRLNGQVGEVYYVADNGAGIAPAYHEKVFGLFEQLEPELGGTGI